MESQSQEKLVKEAIHKVYEKNETLFQEGDSCQSLFIILEGKVKLSSMDRNGKENIYDIIIPGQSIGEDRFLSKEKFPFTATCLSQTKICEIQAKSFQNILQKNPESCINLILALSKKIKSQEEKISLLSENDGLERLAIFLLNRSQRIRSLNIQLSIEEIAASINLRAETVSRKIAQLSELGLIQRQGKSKISILNYQKLKEFSEKNPIFDLDQG